MNKTVKQRYRYCGDIVEKVLDVEISVELTDLPSDKFPESLYIVEWPELGSHFFVCFHVTHVVRHSYE
jgi:hypothetical protein